MQRAQSEQDQPGPEMSHSLGRRQRTRVPSHGTGLPRKIHDLALAETVGIR
jgi:hypothetical protein